jgi:hypothetical protein
VLEHRPNKIDLSTISDEAHIAPCGSVAIRTEQRSRLNLARTLPDRPRPRPRFLTARHGSKARQTRARWRRWRLCGCEEGCRACVLSCARERPPGGRLTGAGTGCGRIGSASVVMMLGMQFAANGSRRERISVWLCASAPTRIRTPFWLHNHQHPGPKFPLTHTQRRWTPCPAPSFFARLLPHLLLLHEAASCSSLLSLPLPLSPSKPTAPSLQLWCIAHTCPIQVGVHIIRVALRAAVVLRASLSTPRLASAGTLCETRAQSSIVSSHHHCHQPASSNLPRQTIWRHS